MPDYQIKRWDEENTDLSTPFLQAAIKRKQWAFVSDYIRLRVIHEQGGVYLDSDIEVVRRFDSLLEDGGCFLGYESVGRLNTGVIGCVPSHPFPKLCMDLMDERFVRHKPYLIAPEVATKAAALFDGDSLRKLDTCYFYPYNPYDPDETVKTFMYSDVGDKTYAVHHWGKAWKQGFVSRLVKRFSR